jgi:hypothetical protein
MVPGIGFIKDWRDWGVWSFDITKPDVNGVEVKIGHGFVVGMFAFGFTYPH